MSATVTSMVWWRWWAIAALGHAASTPTVDWGPRAVANLVVGAVAMAVLVRPRDLRLRTGLAAVVVASAVVEAPVLANHWLLAALVSAAALAARPWRDGGANPSANDSGDPVPGRPGPAPTDTDFVRRFVPTARMILVVFYTFAALAKLNHGFLDPLHSCARFFTNQTLDFWGLPLIGSTGPLAGAPALVALAVEASVPVLLVVPATRRFGVHLALAFHLGLTLDLNQHFYDFTLVLIPLLTLFGPPATLGFLDRALPQLRLGRGWPWVVVASLVLAGYHLPLPTALRWMAVYGARTIWVGLLILLTVALVRSWLHRPARPARRVDLDGVRWWGSVGPIGWLVVGLTVANGLAPYLNLKTATSFTMYSNLVVVDGETNHLSGLAIAGVRAQEPVEILAADQESLSRYVGSGFAVPRPNLADHLARHPEAARGLRTTAATLAPDRLPWWQDRLLAFRSVPPIEAPRCQNAWLPLG